MTLRDFIANFDTIAEAPNGIARLREFVLQLAVRGRLVPQAPEDEPATMLLDRITAERNRLVKDKKISKPKMLPEITRDEMPAEVPEGWITSVCQKIDIYLNTKNKWRFEVTKIFHIR